MKFQLTFIDRKTPATCFDNEVALKKLDPDAMRKVRDLFCPYDGGLVTVEFDTEAMTARVVPLKEIGGELKAMLDKANGVTT